MVFQRNKLAAAVGCLLGIGGILLPLAAPAQTPDIRVDVTGSNIKRVEGEGALPVEIVTREEIQRTGARTVNELLRYIPSVDIYDQGEIASNSPSGSGTATIRLRGLSETNVLVLLNGRRLPVNALYDSTGAGAAVDVNMIPISAIERVEILKDGGSAIYGADAVAGVVNFITRKDFRASK
jgi:iron complex outermembrane receptor protein